LIRGELRKVAYQRSNWALPLAAMAVGWVTAAGVADGASRLGHFAYAIDTYRAFAAAAAGVVVLGVSARLVAMEYQTGTVRVVLARGVGRLQLLAAKLAAVGVVALAVLVGLTIAGIVFMAVRLQQLPGAVAWHDVWVAALTVALSAAVCGLLGTAAGAVGRSLTFAAAVAVGFFPVDNGLGYVLPILETATHERVWNDLTTYLLGPDLNHLPAVLMSRPAGELVPPALPVDATHGLLVIGTYAAVFVAAAVATTWRRDTLE
jgi:hypothetical protein